MRYVLAELPQIFWLTPELIECIYIILESQLKTPKKVGVMDNQSQKPCLCAVLRKATRVVTKRYDIFLKPSGLKITQYSMLANISRNEGITVSRLAKVMLMDQTTVTRNLQLLKKKGYIFYQEGGDDHRVKQIELSGSGKERLKKAQSLWELAQREIESELGSFGFDVILRSLNFIIK